MQSVFRGEFGRSLGTGNSVAEDLARRIPATLELATYGVLLGVAIGIPLGLVAAVRRGKLTDHIVRILNIAMQSVPAFWLGVVLIFVVFFQLRLVPSPVGRLSPLYSPPPFVTGFFTIDALIAGKPDVALAALRQLILPVVVLGLGVVSPLARITRAAMGESLGQDYVTFGRALGLRERQVVLGDAFRGALVPIVTTFGFVVANVLAGAAIVETVFSWPGIGRYAITAITTSDMAPVSTCILLVAASVAVINLLVDLSYALIDPRIRHGYGK
jgi:peptide/nickel transport system permease protein